MGTLLPIVFLLALAGVLTLVARLVTRNRVHGIALRRLRLSPESAVTAVPGEGPLRQLRRHYLLPVLGAAAVSAGGVYLMAVPPVFGGAFAMVMLVFGTLVDANRVNKATQRLELQLADAIDLMVGSVRAGMGAVDAMEAAMRETKKPLKNLFGEMIGRMRLGDDPQMAVRLLSERVPLESCRLFTSALSVHWEIGGALGPTLTGVGRTIRDRVELGRRVKSQATQARVSVIVFLLVTYFLALVNWQARPDRMAAFINSGPGEILVAAAIGVQAVGILWISRLSRIPY